MRSGQARITLTALMDWLFEIVGRAIKGEPPVTEAEFVELAAWFAAHDAELTAVEPLDAGGGRLVWRANVRYDLATGRGRSVPAGSPRTCGG